MKYIITVSGCDDSTSVVMELTSNEYKLIQELSKKITEESYYQCMPTMKIEEVNLTN